MELEKGTSPIRELCANGRDSGSPDTPGQVPIEASDFPAGLDRTHHVADQLAGMATVTATLGTVSDSTLVTVFNLAPQLIVVTPVNPSITVGQTQHFSATAYFSNGTTQDVTASAHWSSSSANISTINSGHGGGFGKRQKERYGHDYRDAGVSGSTTLTVN